MHPAEGDAAQIQIEYSPSFALAIIRLDPGESIRAEAGAMVSMAGVDIETKARAAC